MDDAHQPTVTKNMHQSHSSIVKRHNKRNLKSWINREGLFHNRAVNTRRTAASFNQSQFVDLLLELERSRSEGQLRWSSLEIQLEMWGGGGCWFIRQLVLECCQPKGEEKRPLRKLLDVVKEDMETVGVTVEEVMMRWRKTICCDNPWKEQPKKKKICNLIRGLCPSPWEPLL